MTDPKCYRTCYGVKKLFFHHYISILTSSMENNDNSKPIIFSLELEDIFQREDKTKLLQTLQENRESFPSKVFDKVLNNTIGIPLYMVFLTLFWVLLIMPQVGTIHIGLQWNFFGIWKQNLTETDIENFIWFLSGILFTLLWLNLPHVWKAVKEKYSFLR